MQGRRPSRRDPDIEVARRSRDAVDSHRVGADDEESHAGLLQGPEEVAEVLVHSGTGQTGGRAGQGRRAIGVSRRVYLGRGLPVRAHASADRTATIASRSSAVVEPLRSSPGSPPRRKRRTGHEALDAARWEELMRSL
jgi:hypothetical protein